MKVVGYQVCLSVWTHVYFPFDLPFEVHWECPWSTRYGFDTTGNCPGLLNLREPLTTDIPNEPLLIFLFSFV